ncbi:MAG: endonuclease/exonuclease/phosphatase [Gammaproteobacteria bacterium]|nr:endonuclease/exonuclease/phosphatase [Gammaproteobacteria bacterium]NIR98064.1 endonuclease/exonuclease/phosphatase [Gammaproteobacteria bacterium]NIT63774.1 endonuclease/exonuclease/phosphatase [Gammaproteobacteria bacterium]NIV20724.1 endonuclease/exonuclease/phosphatase [Gammaproteobacteria bacterium]NIY32354.1 endonuclease/exonuclease/phosphatase [Gammaproteobacteria bacterium]
MTEHYVAFWNLENLFDVENSPRRSEKLQRTLARELDGWSQAVLDRKVNQLASIIQQMNGGRGPDLLGACEVENEHVLDLLVAALAPLGRDYAVAHADTSDRRGIDVAFVFDADRFAAEDQFSHFIVKRAATRDLFQVNFRTASGRLLVVIGNHWPSRSGGQYSSEPYRIIAGETLAYFHERIREIHGDGAMVLAMGDFNDEPHDRSITEHALGERSRAKVMNARSPKLLNLMWPILGEGIGTHYFSNNPNVLDQFLISRSLATGGEGVRTDAATVEVVRLPEMVDDGDYPKPVRFGRKDSVNNDGFSDHFPIAMTVHEE